MRYLEDLHAGETIPLGSVVVDREEAIAFARRYDPQPFHVDDAAGEALFGGIIASGWHTGAMFSRLCVDGFLHDVANLGGLGFDETRFHAPVRPGDELWGLVEVLDVRASQRRPDRGTLTMRGTLRARDTSFEADGERTVFTMQMSIRVARRPVT